MTGRQFIRQPDVVGWRRRVKGLRRFRSVVALALLATLGASRPTVAMTIDPLSLYGTEIRFDVMRMGEKVGSHTVRFARARDVLSVETSLGVAVRFLGLTVYKYRYVSRSKWRQTRLVELDVQVDDDGTRHAVRAYENGGGLEVLAPGTRFVAPRGVLPTVHWDPSVLGSDRVLNTITGKLNRVEILDLGAATVATAAGIRSARHYRYTGEIEADVWYDSRGRWVKLRFQGKDGSIIDYVCRRCGDLEPE